MDPYNENKLRNEVIYLHYLWHQGPPSISVSLPHSNLQPFHSTHFKKHFKKTPNFNPKKPRNFSGKEWPVKPPAAEPPATQSGWPELKLKPNPNPTRSPTQEELSKHKWNQVQQKALKDARAFYSRNSSSDDDDDMDDDDDDDVDDDDDDDEVEDEEYGFFWKMFNGDDELKSYYVKNCGGGGDFLCLVCCGANEKHGKRFKDCVALVQHSISIAKTKKKRSHRAYGQVVCRVLGWDIDRLPAFIVSDFKSGESQGNDVNGDKDFSLNKIIDNGGSNLVGSNGKDNGVSDADMVCENSSVVANREEENTEKPVLNEPVNYLCRNLSSAMVLEARK